MWMSGIEAFLQAPAAPPPGALASDASSEPPAKLMACLPCSKSKLKCDYSVPCERCFRHNLTCVQVLPRPQQQQRKRRSRSSAPASGATAAGKKARERLPPVVDGRPLVELALSRSDPGVAAGVFLRTFYQCLSEGIIIQSSVLALMRVWRTWSIASGSDVTWGILDNVAEALKIAPWELEEPGALGLDVPEAERRRRALIAAGEIRRAQGQLPPELEMVKPDFDGGAATTFSILPGPGNAAEGAGLSSPGQPLFQQWSNPAYMRMVKALVDLQGDVLRYRAIQILLMVSLIAPQDRGTYMHGYHRSFFAESPRLSTLFKASYGDGQVRLYLMSIQRIQLQDGRVAIKHQVELCPKSKHVTDMPDAGFHLVRKFRRDGGGNGVSSNDALTAADAGSSGGGGGGGGHAFGSGTRDGGQSAARSCPSQTGVGIGAASFVVPGLATMPMGKGEGAAAACEAALEGEQQLAWLAASRASPSSIFAAAPVFSSSSSVVSASSAAPAPARQQPLDPFHELPDASRQGPPPTAATPPLAPSTSHGQARGLPATAGWASPASMGWKGVGGGGEGLGVGGVGSLEPFAGYGYSAPQPLDDAVAGAIPPLPSPFPQRLMSMPPLSPGLESALAITAAAPSPAAAFPVTSVPVFEGGEEELMNLFDDDDEQGQG